MSVALLRKEWVELGDVVDGDIFGWSLGFGVMLLDVAMREGWGLALLGGGKGEEGGEENGCGIYFHFYRMLLISDNVI